MATSRVRRPSTRNPQVRTCRVYSQTENLILELTIDGDITNYRMVEIPSEFGRGFTLDKLAGDTGAIEDTYTVHVGDPSTCDCLGFTKWNHCKHVESLNSLTENGRI